ncbi:hypothetical protein EB796_022010 [Bugula neritina]|uniref:Peptidase S1 domain-containing protein n=1 Tax=Bugula neritina TaxID=10212 RepID=A0A7J7J1D8_BUGNE|nr:hypothetical protein EB796_022010 [Bugula neritina]
MSHLYIQLYDVDSDSSVNSQELEMTSLQDGGPRESQPSTQMHEMNARTVTSRGRRASRRTTRHHGWCSKRIILAMAILIPIGLAAILLIVLLSTGVINTSTIVGTEPTSTDAFVTCKPNETRCDNGFECLRNQYVCDGNEDCSDNSDERGCENGCQLSPRHFYFCKNGDCVKKAWRCDRELDCVDGDDEFDCEHCNSTTEFTCNNYDCVPIQSRCNGVYDCDDRSDEYSCFHQSSDTTKYFYNSSYIDLCHTPDVAVSANRICALLGYRSDGAQSSPIPRDDSTKPAVSLSLWSETSKANGTFIVQPDFSCRAAVNLKCQSCGISTKQIWAAYLLGGVGGFPITDWPWHVKLTIGSTHICGGSILSDKWILTAGHCVASITNPSDIKVVYGTNRFDGSGGTTRIARRIVIHPQYKPTLYRGSAFTTYSYDFAMIQVDSIQYSARAQPACLPTQDDLISDDTNCYITGFGSIVANSQQPHYPKYLQEGKTRVVSDKVCNIQYKTTYRLDVPEEWLCAGYVTAGIDSCVGDSGGPLVCLMNKRWVLQGVVSWGSSCKQSIPSIYAKVSVATPWINEYTAT